MGKFAYTYVNGNYLPKNIDYLRGTEHLGVYDYYYDKKGNIVRLNDHKYQYDDLGQLIQWDYYKENNMVLIGEELVWEKAMTDINGLVLDKTQLLNNTLQLTSESHHNVAITSKIDDLYTIQTKNALQNPDFEMGTAGTTGIPSSWLKNIYNTNSSTISIIADPDYRFNKCVKLDNTRLTTGNSLNIESTDIPVVPGKTYRQKGWVKGNGTANLYLGRAWYDKAGTLLSYNYIAAAVNPTSWTYYQGDVVAPANAAKCRIWCTNYNNTTGIGYFDNLEFYEITSPIFDFEGHQEDVAGVPVGWTLSHGTVTGIIIASDTVDHKGTKVLKFDNSKIGTNTKLGIESSDISVIGGGYYRQSGWVKSDGTAQIYLGVLWIDSTGAQIGTSYTLYQSQVNHWYYAESKLTAPANAVKCRLYLVNANNSTGVCYFDSITFGPDIKTSETAWTSRVIKDAKRGYVVQKVDQKVEYTEVFTTPGRVNTTHTNASVDATGTVKLPLNTTEELLNEEIVQTLKLELTNAMTNRYLGTTTAANMLKRINDPGENWPNGSDPNINSSYWNYISSVNLGDLSRVTDIQFMVNCTLKRSVPIWIKFQVNDVNLGMIKFEALQGISQENSCVLNLSALNIPNLNASTLKLYWIFVSNNIDPTATITTTFEATSLPPKYIDYGTINYAKVYAQKENIYSLAKTHTYQLTKTLQNTKVYRFKSIHTIPTGTSISYELHNSSGKIMDLGNDQTFTVPATGLYSIKANLATTNNTVSPQIDKVYIFEITTYPAQASLQLNTYAISLPCTTLDIYPTETLPTGTEIVYYANNNGNQTTFVPATKISNGHYRVNFAQSGNQIVLRAILKSNVYQSVTPTLSKVNFKTDAAYYHIDGSVQTKDLSITVPSEKLWLELSGMFNVGHVGVSLKIGNTTIQGMPLSIQTAPLDANDPLYSSASSERTNAIANGLQSKCYEFVLPESLRGVSFTGRLTFTLTSDANKTNSPSIYNYILFGRLNGFAMRGSFESGWIDKPYSTSKFRLDVTDLVPTGTSIVMEVDQGQLSNPIRLTEGENRLLTDLKSFKLRGILTSNKLLSPTVSKVTLTAIGEQLYVNNLDATSDMKSGLTAIQLSSDRAVGQNSLKITHTSTNGVAEYVIDDSWLFDVTKLPVIKIWVKPLNANTSLSFKTFDVQDNRWKVIMSDVSRSGNFRVGSDMVVNEWNLLLLDLRETVSNINKYAKGLTIYVNNTSTEFCIDGISQLPENQTVYNYDGVGNRTTVVENGLVTTYYYYPGTNKLQRTINANECVDYSYDRNGNLTSKIIHKGTVQTQFDYVFNSLNQLMQVKKDGIKIAEYSYDEGGLRYKKVDYLKNETTIYIYGLGTEPMYDEVYNNSSLTSAVSKNSYLNMGATRIARAEGASISYYYTDHLGSTRIVMDGAGKCTYNEYAPFGEDFGATNGERYKFTGKEDDGVTGLQYFNARYYDPAIGRFISEDIARDGINWYVYCNNSPLILLDPTGQFDIPFIGKEKNALSKALGAPKTILAGVIALDRKYAAIDYSKIHNLGNAIDNEADAYRHFTWNVANMRAFGQKDARTIANIHEIYNGGMGTSLSSKMDLWNNAIGRSLALFFPHGNLDGVWNLAKSLGIVVLDTKDLRLANVTSDDWQFCFPPNGAIPEWVLAFLSEAHSNGWTAEKAQIEYDKRKKK